LIVGCICGEVMGQQGNRAPSLFEACRRGEEHPLRDRGALGAIRSLRGPELKVRRGQSQGIASMVDGLDGRVEHFLSMPMSQLASENTGNLEVLCRSGKVMACERFGPTAEDLGFPPDPHFLWIAVHELPDDGHVRCGDGVVLALELLLELQN